MSAFCEVTSVPLIIFTVVNYDSQKFKRLIKEFLLVTKDKSLLNKQVKSLKLELFQCNFTYPIL